MNNYQTKEFYNDLLIIANDDVELHYSKYSLCILSDYFKSLIIFNNEVKDKIKLDLNSKTLIMFLHWSDKHYLNIDDIYIDNIIELWDFSHETLCKDFSDYCNEFILTNINKIIEHHDILLVFLKSCLYMIPPKWILIRDLCVEKVELVLKSPEIKNLKPNQIKLLSTKWPMLIKILNIWITYNDNINNISKTRIDFSKIPRTFIKDLENVIISTEDNLFLKQICKAFMQSDPLTFTFDKN